MEPYNFTLQPLFISNVHSEARTQVKRDHHMNVRQAYFIKDISEPKSDMYRAKIKCMMSIQEGEDDDLVYLYFIAYTTFECQIPDDGVDFDRLIELNCVPAISKQLRETVAKLTQDLFGVEIKV